MADKTWWQLHPWATLFADPVAENTPLENGKISIHLLTHAYILQRLTQSRRADLEASGINVEVLDTILPLLIECAQFATAGEDDSLDEEGALELLEYWKNKISSLAIGESILAPGGWKGKVSVGRLIYIIERKGENEYSFITCNSGRGSEYHPSSVTEETKYPKKIKIKTCAKIENIKKEKIIDPAFWGLLFSLWMKSPDSEYHRHEVIYEVLLPWLGNNSNSNLLPELFSSALLDDQSDWRTPQRSSTVKCVWEAMRYLLKGKSFTHNQLKQLSFLIKQEYIVKAGQELLSKAQGMPTISAVVSKCIENGLKPDEGPDIKDFLPEFSPTSESTPTVAQVCEMLGDQAIINHKGEILSSTCLQNKTFGIYFSASWCPPCRGFTPVLAEVYNAIAGKHPGEFEVLFISADRSPESFAEYYKKMPWLALQFDCRNSNKNLSRLFKVKGIPSLILFDKSGALLSKNGTKLISSDPTGDSFPWAAVPSVRELLAQMKTISKAYGSNYHDEGGEEEGETEPNPAENEQTDSTEPTDNAQTGESEVGSENLIASQEAAETVATSEEQQQSIPAPTSGDNQQLEKKDQEAEVASVSVVKEDCLSKPQEKEEGKVLVCNNEKCELLPTSQVESEEKKEEQSKQEETEEDGEKVLVCDDEKCELLPRSQVESEEKKEHPEEQEEIEAAQSSSKGVDATTLEGKYIAIYFSDPSYEVYNFAEMLQQMYHTVKRRLPFEIIEIVLTQQISEHETVVNASPWYHLSFDHPEKRNIISKFKVSTAPVLAVYSPDGKLIHQNAVELLYADRRGFRFPWTELNFTSLAATIGSSLINKTAEPVNCSSLTNHAILGLYFSASWCPPCKQFTPVLKESYDQLNQSRPGQFEVIFVSFDREKDAFDEYYSSMPWLAVAFDNNQVRETLAKELKVSGIPFLVLFDKDGNIITTDGRRVVSDDPRCEQFPWQKSASNQPTMTEDFELAELDVKLLKIGCQQLANAAVKEYNNHRSPLDVLEKVKLLTTTIDDLVDNLPQAPSSSGIPDKLDAQLKVEVNSFTRGELLLEKGVDKYAGEAKKHSPPKPLDFLTVPRKVETFEQLKEALANCDQLVKSLFDRSRRSNSSASLAIQLEIISLITDTFTIVIPIAKPVDLEQSNCIWKSAAWTKEEQQRNLAIIYNLLLIYLTAWQAVENPTRSFDAERSLTSACLLVAFEMIVRHVPAENPLVVSQLLFEDGGYGLSSTVCKNNREFKSITPNMEFTNPAHHVTRNNLLEYFDSISRVTQNKLWEIEMQQGFFELKKYSSTIVFFKKTIEKLGYPLISDEEKANPPSEIDAIGKWLFDPNSRLNTDHPEFSQLRDIVTLFKYGATMETREQELLQRAMEPTGENWNLTFDDGGGAGFYWNRQVTPLAWEPEQFGGAELDVVKVLITAFNTRTLCFGEGLVTNSPISLQAILKVENATEDDILHATNLPTFNNSLSREESEVLLSYLTVEYARIPLVLEFFATQDRVMYLYNVELQELLKSVVFQAGNWSSKEYKIDCVPVRQNTHQKFEKLQDYLRKGIAYVEDKDILATRYGLFLNELHHSPTASLHSLMTLFSAINELTHASVYSVDATFIFFMVNLAIDVETFITFAVDEEEREKVRSGASNTPWNRVYGSSQNLEVLKEYNKKISEYLHRDVKAFLLRWCEEASGKADLATQSVIRSYLALIYQNIPAKQVNLENSQDIFGSLAFVRNWHAFGKGYSLLGQLWAEAESQSAPNERLKRFLQAFGINTENLESDFYEEYLAQPGRPLFLRLNYGAMYKVPTFYSPTENNESSSLIPPVPVPEFRIMAMLQSIRSTLVSWLDQQANETRNIALQTVIITAIRNPTFAYTEWTRSEGCPGRYNSSNSDLTFDAQCCEVFWRNDELKPLPDSMTQYSDYQTIFGKEVYHCGIVAEQQNRLWVHIVGTDFDLQEWRPISGSFDHGVGSPAVYSDLVCSKCNQIGKCWICDCGTVHCNEPFCRRCETSKFNQDLETASAFLHNGIVFDRVFDPYAQTLHPVPSERWVQMLLVPIIRSLFPPCKKLAYPLFFPATPLDPEASVAHLLAFDPPSKKSPSGTWKEIFVFRNLNTVHVYNLISHGRRVYRSLIFTSHSKCALHSLPPKATEPNPKPIPFPVYHSSGDWKQAATGSATLVILRQSSALGGQETYLPPRLLQGIIPSALLESFHFWQGEDLLVRGTPMDDQSQWYNYRLEIKINDPAEDSLHPITIIRKPLGVSFSPISNLRYDETQAAQNIAIIQSRAVGFSEKQAKYALRKAGTVFKAIQWLQDKENTQELAEGVIKMESEKELSEEKLALSTVLENEGFSKESSIIALRLYDGDVDLARSWLLDENNDEIILQKINKLAASSENIDLSNSGSTSLASLDLSVHAAELSLLNLLDVVDGDSFAGRLAKTLTRLEDLSHILIWISTSADSLTASAIATNQGAIHIIEFPRLKLKFQPKKEADGKIKMYLLEHEGWFISDHVESDESQKLLVNLLEGIENYLILENSARELQVIIANQDLFRPDISNRAFSRFIVPNRGSFGWQQSMDARYYLYPVHTSKSFLLYKTLGSTLYMALLQFLIRNYDNAFELLESCFIDTTFTIEEKWILNQFARTMSDLHPDAHACRIKLSLATGWSTYNPEWKLEVEFHKNLLKFDHVSSKCLLSLEEQHDVLQRCKESTTVLDNWKSFLHATPGAQLSVSGDEMKCGGLFWHKLCCYSSEVIGNSSSCTVYNCYELGDKLGSDQAFSIIWNNLVVADEVSGNNSHLGFMFLYQLLQSVIKVELCGSECTANYAELLIKFFQLKLARFGKFTSLGEVDQVVSKQVVLLSAMLEQPEYEWPAFPNDKTSLAVLANGVDIYSGEGYRTQIKPFIEQCNSALSKYVTSEAREIQLAIRSANFQSLCEHESGKQTVSIPVVPISDDSLPGARYLYKTSNLNSSKLQINAETVGISNFASELKQFINTPLNSIELDNYVAWKTAAISAKIPFDISKHPAAKTAVAIDMLQRIGKDVEDFETMCNSTLKAELKGFSNFSEESDFEALSKQLKSLLQKLHALQQDDSKQLVQIIDSVITESNAIPHSAEDSHLLFHLNRYANKIPCIDIKFLIKVVLSSKAGEDLLKINPFMASSTRIIELITVLLFYSTRVSHTNRAISLAQALLFQLSRFSKLVSRISLSSSLRLSTSLSLSQSGALSTQSNIAEKIDHFSRSLAETLTDTRNFVTSDHSFVSFDPRFLVFEFIFDIMLRKRQVEMVDWFVDNCAKGISRVQQMIMGAGKTTVVGPLLALILANGESLVSQVMPTALLEQTRNIMRSRFSTIITKRVYTFEFSRGIDENLEFIDDMLSKLETARKHGSVVCAPPEAIKALLLKFVEYSHSLESVPLNDILEDLNTPSREKESRRFYEKIQLRSRISDKLVRVIELWRKGVLIMDEVDVLLHPLRSELNFPIGEKAPIDLAGYRWDYPIHMIDAVFHASTANYNDLADWVEVVGKKLSINPKALLIQLNKALEEGYKSHVIQKTPHLVILDQLFYHKSVKNLLAQWSLIWLWHHFLGTVNLSPLVVLDYIQGINIEANRSTIEENLVGENKKLLNLVGNWVTSLAAHILSKINRVGYGILHEADISLIDRDNTPLGRLLMAIPFVGKDVPSKASEFAHPDVLIGLTVLAYRYEGLRASDVTSIITQLKKDYSHQIGPRESRPASILFDQWTLSKNNEGNAVLPLPLLQLHDKLQMKNLFNILTFKPDVIHYYLKQHVFPTCLNFQETKLSACGHELGSSLLFRNRIGFSGTPSNLLPIDLGDCQYEPGSDGKIIHTLTNPLVVSASKKLEWTARSLLKDVCTGEFHCLIDTGALITGLDNEEVAQFLLKHLPEWMEGVVYLDRRDRQMILLRASGKSIHLSQCGINPDRRFSFYDQIHTTGMDIKQAASAKAAVTLGKDMNFRDYAQGCFRMRGIGKGQTIELFIIPEVNNRIEQELIEAQSFSNQPEIDVPAWLLINSMKMESLQFIQLSTQELFNIWKKRALQQLIDEVKDNASESVARRVKRFELRKELVAAISQFREHIDFNLPNEVPKPRTYSQRINELIEKYSAMTQTNEQKQLIAIVQKRIQQITDNQADDAISQYRSDMLHEQEAEQEEEILLEEEEEQICAFSRDDEQQDPWPVSILAVSPRTSNEAQRFYKFSNLKLKNEQLAFPTELLLSENFYKPRWIGIGDRRLKTICLFLQWIPNKQVHDLTAHYFVAISLAEGETIRKLMHEGHNFGSDCTVALWTLHSRLLSPIDASPGHSLIPVDVYGSAVSKVIQVFRFFNCEMFYSDEQLEYLEDALKNCSLPDRLRFFSETLRLRKRQRNLWAETPVAKIFTPQEQWHLARVFATKERFVRSLKLRMKQNAEFEPVLSFSSRSETASLSYEDFQRLLQSFKLPRFNPIDYYDIAQMIDVHSSGSISLEQFKTFINYDPDEFNKPPQEGGSEENVAESVDDMLEWTCNFCQMPNLPEQMICVYCDAGQNPILGGDGADDFGGGMPDGMWICTPGESGGCSYMNPNTFYYCEMCQRARPGLSATRF